MLYDQDDDKLEFLESGITLWMAKAKFQSKIAKLNAKFNEIMEKNDSENRSIKFQGVESEWSKIEIYPIIMNKIINQLYLEEHGFNHASFPKLKGISYDYENITQESPSSISLDHSRFLELLHSHSLNAEIPFS